MRPKAWIWDKILFLARLVVVLIRYYLLKQAPLYFNKSRYRKECVAWYPKNTDMGRYALVNRKSLWHTAKVKRNCRPR